MGNSGFGDVAATGILKPNQNPCISAEVPNIKGLSKSNRFGYLYIDGFSASVDENAQQGSKTVDAFVQHHWL
jgi:hypothetical protein